MRIAWMVVGVIVIVVMIVSVHVIVAVSVIVTMIGRMFAGHEATQTST